MATKIYDVTLTAAQQQALAPNTYYWIDRFGNLVAVGGAALIGAVAVPTPSDQASMDVSLWNGLELFASHGVLTSAVGGKLSVAQLQPDLAPLAGTPVVVGAATTDQVLAATAESVTTTVLAAQPASRLVKIAIAILFTTVPTVANPLKIQLWAHRDGQQRARG